MIIQLNPMLPVVCPKGKGYAFALIDYSQEHHLMFVIALDDTGEIWTFENPEVRVQFNQTIKRGIQNVGKEVDTKNWNEERSVEKILACEKRGENSRETTKVSGTQQKPDYPQRGLG